MLRWLLPVTPGLPRTDSVSPSRNGCRVARRIWYVNPVHLEILCRHIVNALYYANFNAHIAGESHIDRKGELVIIRPFPSMPVSFWDDPDGSKYHNAYFSKFPGKYPDKIRTCRCTSFKLL